MDTTTINGLHSCKPGNDPVVGQVKLMVVQHMTSKKSGKPYLKIKNANAENGGTPHRILSAEPTGFTDANGNISFNIEVEPSSSPPSTVQNLRATMQQGDPEHGQRHHPPENEPESSVHAQQGEDGVTQARKHLMRCCNLYNLCIAAAEKAIAPGMPEIARTSEQFQSTLASLWIEASSRRSTDGVTWWSWVDRMPATPVNGGKHSTTAKPIQKQSEGVDELDGGVPF